MRRTTAADGSKEYEEQFVKLAAGALEVEAVIMIQRKARATG